MIMTDLIKLEIEAIANFSLYKLNVISREEAAEIAIKLEYRVNKLVHANLKDFSVPLPDDFPAFTCQYIALLLTQH